MAVITNIMLLDMRRTITTSIVLLGAGRITIAMAINMATAINIVVVTPNIKGVTIHQDPITLNLDKGTVGKQEGVI